MTISDSQSTTQLKFKLTQKLGELDSVTKKEIQSNFVKNDFIDISNESKYDKNDYQRVLEKFKSSDSEIRTHEQAHAASGHTTTPISYKYQTGPDGNLYAPDGNLYAVGGEVRLDTSIPSDPQAAAFKLSQIQKSATAPSGLSSADAQISIQANLNKMLLLSKGEENAS